MGLFSHFFSNHFSVWRGFATRGPSGWGCWGESLDFESARISSIIWLRLVISHLRNEAPDNDGGAHSGAAIIMLTDFHR
jgi:hypothetical protein